MAMLTIGSALTNPSEYAVSISDLDSDDSGRSETGLFHRNRRRAGVYKIQASFKVSRTELKAITDAIAAASFSVTFFDPFTATDATKTMYVGDRSAKLMNYTNEAAPAESYWNLSCNFIEF